MGQSFLVGIVGSQHTFHLGDGVGCISDRWNRGLTTLVQLAEICFIRDVSRLTGVLEDWLTKVIDSQGNVTPEYFWCMGILKELYLQERVDSPALPGKVTRSVTFTEHCEIVLLVSEESSKTDFCWSKSLPRWQVARWYITRQQDFLLLWCFVENGQATVGIEIKFAVHVDTENGK